MEKQMIRVCEGELIHYAADFTFGGGIMVNFEDYKGSGMWMVKFHSAKRLSEFAVPPKTMEVVITGTACVSPKVQIKGKTKTADLILSAVCLSDGPIEFKANGKNYALAFRKINGAKLPNHVELLVEGD